MKWSRDRLQSWQLSLLFGLTLAGYPATAALSTILGFENRIGSIIFRVGLIVICATVIIGSRLKYPKAGRLTLWFLVLFFWLLYVTRIVWDVYLTSSLLSRPSHLYLGFAIGGCFIPMIAFMLTGRINERVMEKVRVASFLMVLVSSVMVLWVYYQSAALELASQSRLKLEALNPISAGHLGGSLVILSGFCLLERLTQNRWTAHVATYWIALAIGMVLLVSSASRGPIVATAVALGVYGISRLRHRNGIVNFLAIGTFFVGGTWLAAIVEAKLGFSSFSRVLNLIEMGGSDLTTSFRISSITAAWEQFLASPLFGSGLEERYSRFYPHNVIVEAFMATGIVGGATFAILLAAAGLSAWRILLRRSRSGWVAMLCIQYLVAAQFSGALWASTVMWSLIGGVFSAKKLSVVPAIGFPRAQPAAPLAKNR